MHYECLQKRATHEKQKKETIERNNKKSAERQNAKNGTAPFLKQLSRAKWK